MTAVDWIMDSSHSKFPRPSALDLTRVSPNSIRTRKNLVSRDQFVTVVEPGCTVAEFLDSLPSILAAEELKAAVHCTAESVRNGCPVVVAMGGHVVKVGLAPIIIDLMERGVVSALVMNGATAIHDYEIALIGETSEDVAINIADGSFGMSTETAAAFAEASEAGSTNERGLGRALGELILSESLPHQGDSLLAAAARLEVAATVHVAMGTDIVHMHPQIDGSSMGAATHIDFRILAAVACSLGGGTWINMGSAVVLPEVFLKVVNIARNLGFALEGLTAINFDMMSHYRTSQNVLRRPVDRGISLIGHHEINIPLFRVALLEALATKSES